MVMGGVGARVDAGKDGTLQASAFKAEVTGEYGDGFGRMGDGELAWQEGDRDLDMRQWIVYSYDALSRSHDQL